MAKKSYNVIVEETVGDGSYFDFTFKVEGSDTVEDKIIYRLYPHNREYPQKELIYKNYEYGKTAPFGEVIEFRAAMPGGYRVAYQITQNNAWQGVRGLLTILQS